MKFLTLQVSKKEKKKKEKLKWFSASFLLVFFSDLRGFYELLVILHASESGFRMANRRLQKAKKERTVAEPQLLLISSEIKVELQL